MCNERLFGAGACRLWKESLLGGALEVFSIFLWHVFVVMASWTTPPPKLSFDEPRIAFLSDIENAKVAHAETLLYYRVPVKKSAV